MRIPIKVTEDYHIYGNGFQSNSDLTSKQTLNEIRLQADGVRKKGSLLQTVAIDTGSREIRCVGKSSFFI